jgi:transcriptional regulator GlxA family with amidase domain
MNETPLAARKFSVAMLIYPGMTLLDMAGPQALWAFHSETYFVWEQRGPVPTDTGVAVVATHTFTDCPEDVDVVCVPGGFGTWDVIRHEGALSFLRRSAASARYVTSVCTGSIILAAAGLLDGYRAATHWATYPVLEMLGVEGIHERVVVDRNRITGGGVTAGIDFGLTVLAELLGEEAARATQLMVEYDPAPPFDSGSPSGAGPTVTAAVQATLSSDIERRALPAVRAVLERRQAIA